MPRLEAAEVIASCATRYAGESVQRAGLTTRMQEFISPALYAQIAEAHRELLGFDQLTPTEIRHRLAVPHIMRRENGDEVTVGWLTLGKIADAFPDYIRTLKGDASSEPAQLPIRLELAMFLLVLKDCEAINNLRDFFTDEFTSWHQRFQGPSLRNSFLRLIGGIRGEARAEFYPDADYFEQIVILTDFIHTYCIAAFPYFGGKYDLFDESWLDTNDGKTIGYCGMVLDEVREEP